MTPPDCRITFQFGPRYLQSQCPLCTTGSTRIFHLTLKTVSDETSDIFPVWPTPPITTFCCSQSFCYSVSCIFFSSTGTVTYLRSHFYVTQAFPIVLCPTQTCLCCCLPACSSMLCSLPATGMCVIWELYFYARVFNCSRLELYHNIGSNFFIPNSFLSILTPENRCF